MSTPIPSDAVYLDAGRSTDERVDDLLSRMTVEEKAGQLFQTMAVFAEGVPPTEPADFIGKPAASAMIGDRQMTHFNMLGAGTAAGMATWHNELQDLALETRLKIPVTLSSDPRHGFGTNLGTALETAAFSSWPEALGLAAIDDEELVGQFAAVSRQELRAVGIRLALHPQLDVATEPRWARTYGTFGEDPSRVARLGAAYLRGLRADRLGADSVAAMVKHFPGNGPVENGEDPHFPHGKRQIYPAGAFDAHLEPFRIAIAAGVTQIMPSYGVPIGTGHEEVGCSFSRSLITDTLRTELGFDGIVCTDWGLITDASFLGEPMEARAWGVEHLDPPQRLIKALDAGVDQFGGEHCTELIVDLVRSDAVPEERIDVSVRRLLREKFTLGLFDQRHVDVEAAAEFVGSTAFRESGRAAQSRSVTVLTNNRPASSGEPVLPLSPDSAVHVDGINAEVAGQWAAIVGQQDNADVTVLRVATPFEPRSGAFESMFHSGSLGFSPEEEQRILTTLQAGPTVLAVNLERPAIIAPFINDAAAIVVTCGCSDEALLDALFGKVKAQGRLPISLPRSMADVENSATDVPIAPEAASFAAGSGLDLAQRIAKNDS